jgi:hypothetical protein
MQAILKCPPPKTGLTARSLNNAESNDSPTLEMHQVQSNVEVSNPRKAENLDSLMLRQSCGSGLVGLNTGESFHASGTVSK